MTPAKQGEFINKLLGQNVNAAFPRPALRTYCHLDTYYSALYNALDFNRLVSEASFPARASGFDVYEGHKRKVLTALPRGVRQSRSMRVKQSELRCFELSPRLRGGDSAQEQTAPLAGGTGSLLSMIETAIMPSRKWHGGAGDR